MVKKQPIRIAILQRVFPLYRFGFYKALSSMNHPYHFTLFGKQGIDKVKGVEIIPLELFKVSTSEDKLLWKNSETICYHRGKILWQKGILKPILKKEFEVLIMSSQMTLLFYWLVIFCCKVRSIKLVFWSHGLQGHETGLTLLLKKWYLGLADVNLVYANYNKKFMLQNGINRNPIHVVYNSLDIAEQEKYYSKIIKESRAEIKNKYIKNNYPTVLFVSRLEKEKRVDILLKALHLLKSKEADINLFIVGGGPQLETLKSMTTEFGLNDLVYFVGRVYDESELVNYFYISDLFVSPGEVGLNCIHALSYGLPVITHNDFRYQNPEVEAIIENEIGLFFRKDDSQDLADKILYWLINHSKEECSEKARARIKQFYIPEVQAQRVVEGISMLYKNCNFNFCQLQKINT